MQVRFLEVAQRELDEAIEYYSAQVPFFGQAFLIEVLAGLERVKQYPDAWHPLSKNIKRCQLKRFPYGIVYSKVDDDILVLAIAHLHRKPNYWRKSQN